MPTRELFHQKRQRRSLLIHREAFKDVGRRDAILSKALSVVSRWIEMNSTRDKTPSPYWVSWEKKIRELSFEDLKAFALSDSQDAIAHRRASPFSTCLTPEQKDRVLQSLQEEFGNIESRD